MFAHVREQELLHPGVGFRHRQRRIRAVFTGNAAGAPRHPFPAVSLRRGRVRQRSVWVRSDPPSSRVDKVGSDQLVVVMRSSLERLVELFRK